MITINPKEYLKKWNNFSVNKKHKGMKKNIPGMDFEVYSERLATLNGYCFNNKLKKKWAKKISGSKQINANKISQKNTVCRVKW